MLVDGEPAAGATPKGSFDRGAVQGFGAVSQMSEAPDESEAPDWRHAERSRYAPHLNAYRVARQSKSTRPVQVQVPYSPRIA